MKHSQSKLTHCMLSEWWKSMLYYISFHPEGENKGSLVGPLEKYHFDVMETSPSAASETSHVILIYTLQHRLYIHHSSVILADVLYLQGDQV